MRTDLPSGTVTFLFTDIEGSTRLLHELGADPYSAALTEHRRVVREAVGRHGGVEVDTQGDAFFIAFPTADGALAAASEIQQELKGPIRLRMGIHTGTPIVSDEGYVGPDVHKAARIAAAGHGGQVLVSSSSAALVNRARLHDLGDHRLKDLSAAEHLYQVGDGEFPPLKTLYQTNLPVPTTSFLGREREIRDVAELLTRPDVRMVTLSGPGGTGKTRLALQAAGASADGFVGGVWWVPLAPIRDPDLVLPAVGAVLGASGSVAQHIGDRKMLLVLDNFEQVVAAAGDVGRLMSDCPGVQLLVTSREVLQLPGEHVYPVPPLASSEGEQLFVLRATAARPDFRDDGAVGEVCERLDNLPLAIELAAARVRMLSPQQLLPRLAQRLDLLKGGRGTDDRQQTLRATIEWSHDLLSEEEQRLFRRLAIFRGGWTLDAAEQVCDAAIDALQSLVDKSLVRVRDERFSMLETIREFAVQQLQAAGEERDAGARHAAFFFALVKEAEPHVLADDIAWVNRLEAEHNNLRATLDYFDANDEFEAGLQMAGALWRFWYLKSHNTEGLVRLAAAAEREHDSTEARAKAYRGASVMALNVGDPGKALHYAELALELDRELGDKWGEAYSLMMVGNSLSEAFDESRDFRTALERLRESAALFEKLGDKQYQLIATNNQGWILGELGDQEGDKRIHERSLAMAREIGNRGIEAYALGQLGYFARTNGQLDDAADLTQQAIRIDHERGQTANIATHLGAMAAIRVRQGDVFAATRLLGAEEGLYDGRLPWWAEERQDATRALIAEHMDGPTIDRELESGRALGFDEAVALALKPAVQDRSG